MAEKEKKGMFSRLLDSLPFVGDDDEEITPEQQFIDHYEKFGTLLTDDRGYPTLKFSDSLKLYPENTRKDRTNRTNLNLLYEMGNFPSEYRK